MHEFEVWAPEARQLFVEVDGARLAMGRSDGGWWRRAVAAARPGSRYGFAVDDGPVRPDPRSPSQPDGIDGLSEVVDHGAFPWTDGRWRGMVLPGAVLYELHVGTFTAEGTFDAAIERLPHLVALGVDAVELMPVAEFSGSRGWGYDGVDLFAPHHAYGGPDGLKRFVDAAHAVGLGVLLDVVYNHLGPCGNHLREFGPYFSDRHRTNWGDGLNFDGPGSHEVRRFVVDNARHWLRDHHLDGLRLDAVHAIVDDSLLPIIGELAIEVEALASHLRRPLTLVAECDLNDPWYVRSREAGGAGLAGVWADDWHHAVHATLTGETTGYYEDFGSLAVLAKALRQAWVHDGTWSEHRQRHHGRSPTGLSGDRLVVCAQNHDQVGNRAGGERSGALMGEGRLHIAAALLLTGPFTPMLFQGEEWAASTPFLYFTDHQDPALGQAVSHGRRHEFARFGWDPERVPDPQAAATFQRSTLRWEEVEDQRHQGLLSWYRRLIDLRRSTPDLSDPRPGRTAVEVDEGSSTLVVSRGTIGVLVNLGSLAHRFTVRGRARVLAASPPTAASDGNMVAVAPDAVAIVEVAPDGS